MTILSIFLLALAAIAISNYIDHLRIKRIGEERGEANICKFVRDFDYKSIDSKIIREVWNEVQDTLGHSAKNPFPIESEDLLETKYGIVEEDLDEIYWAVADKLGIETDNVEENPYFKKEITIKNLVLLLANQPRIKDE
jgi:hypothetical protein